MSQWKFYCNQLRQRKFILLVERAHFLFSNWCSVGFLVGLLGPLLFATSPLEISRLLSRGNLHFCMCEHLL